MSSVDIVIPVYNEEKELAHSVSTLRRFLQENLTQKWAIIIADNGSTDATLAVAQELARQFPEVSCLHLDQKGRGRALRRAWLESSADIVSYMDVDLSTDLDVFPLLLTALEEGYDVAVGSRLLRQSQVVRSFKREVLSRVYNGLIRALFFASFTDAQCGFKALHRQAAQELVPQVENNHWFFDTELLLLAAKLGYRIWEVAVDWRENPDSRVRVLSTAAEDLRGLARLRWRFLCRRYTPRASSQGKGIA